ncbi:cupin domain-containing protein [Rhizobium lentis]|uniref:Cupin domain-containing protein n=2 Tax=Rhizobium lentis TaxID=1138194 RepID=A0ABS7ID22_9HYPH|nr:MULTISPECIES: cupin domain-containing protein [Rhizobium]MBX4922330.1 cupin domain-containing protein [Rhizobium bangladeshense]MBX5041204.1 cupin domain-containing protein [Rhizobium lentis]MBX5051903.1 cupin domain-containing protein [Rhizobium lentis]MBX5071461.1 cupin domain-containing protein [Rhizobium lentis]MBX5088431.1 cupin domain-containing protein [Rhizobium lentis]
MQVTRYSEARPYEAPEHYGMACLRLQGKEATQTDTVWIGLSHLLPGGETSLKDAAVEKIYVVVAGEVTVETPTESVTLAFLDSCRLAPGEARRLVNKTNAPASILLAMPTG